jgi:hypothetical protein
MEASHEEMRALMKSNQEELKATLIVIDLLRLN